MRDALSIFDQIVSFAGNKILYTDVIKNLNILDYEYYFKLTQAFLDNNISEALLLFNEILDKGFDGHNFLNGMSGHLRDLLVCKDQVTLELLDVGATIREKYLSQSQACDQDFIYSALDICSSADISYKSSRNQRLHVELTLIRLCNISSVKKKTVADIEEPTDQKTEAKEDLKIQQEQNAEPGDESKTEPGLDKVTNSDRTDLPESEADIRAFQQKSISPKKTSTGLSIKDALNGNMNDNKHASDPTEEKQITEPPLNEPFTQEQLISHWQKFADDILSERPRMYNTLKSHLPQLASGFEISVLLDNTTQKDEFNKEIRQDLTRYLKISLNNTQLEIIPSVKVEDSDQVKLYTAEEKYEFMNKKNPNLGKMKQHFNLDFD